MRIISQDGTIDVPYEMIAIHRYKEKIYFFSKNLVGIAGVTEDIVLAEYSTEVKAKKSYGDAAC